MRRIEALFVLGFPEGLRARDLQKRTEINADRAELDVNFKPRQFGQKTEISVKTEIDFIQNVLL